MNLPKTVTIYGKDWKVIKDPKSNGGCFDGSDNTIEIGTRCKGDVLQFFLHEVIEAVLTSNLLRYRGPHNPAENGDYIFVFTHKDLENLTPQIALALKGILKV